MKNHDDKMFIKQVKELPTPAELNKYIPQYIIDMNEKSAKKRKLVYKNYDYMQFARLLDRQTLGALESQFIQTSWYTDKVKTDITGILKEVLLDIYKRDPDNVELLTQIRENIIKIFSSKKTDENKYSDDYPNLFGKMNEIPEAQ